MPEIIAPSVSNPDSNKNQTSAPPRRRTAVLVVHGMGSQRALDTVRGIVKAVWLDKDYVKPGKNDKQYWLHPERKSDDIDLAVLTTNSVPGTADDRSVDFHELYWAHLMSETRAVAVLLWLFELVRKGPNLKKGMRSLWWGATIFLCLLISSVVLLGLHAILKFLDELPLSPKTYSYHEPEALFLAPFFILFMAAAYIALFSAINRAGKIFIWAAVITVVTGFIYFRVGDENIRHAVNLFLPIVVSILAVAIIMGGRGAWAMVATSTFSRRCSSACICNRDT